MKKQVSRCYIWGIALEAPLFCLYTLLGVILCKESQIGAWELMVLCAFKPLVALFSTYWNGSGRRLIMQAALVGIAPTFFFPWVQSSWFFIGGFALFFLAQRTAIPPWIELLRRETTEKERSQIVARGAAVGYLTAAALPLVIGPLLDRVSGFFPWLFVIAGSVSALRLALQWFALPKLEAQMHEALPEGSLEGSLMEPWKRGFELLVKRPDFAWYQILFFCGGLGLMVMQPALPQFVSQVLGLSYTKVGIAFAGAKGVGFALATPLAARWFSRISIFRFSGGVTLLAALSLSLILFSEAFEGAIYVAFFCYGVMQAGSHLSWHLAGPHFSKGEDSVPYTRVNIALVGFRGLIGPLIGGALMSAYGLRLPFVFGIGLCLVATLAAFGVLGARARA